MATGMFSGGAAFGVFPQMQPRRRFQDPAGAANVPVDVTRGRLAGLLGLAPDLLNFMGRSPMPTEMFGETQYEPTPQMPYGSEYYLQNLPLKPTARIGEVAGQAGAFVPLNPMPAARAVAAGARALGPTAVRMGEGYLQSKGLMPGVVEGESVGMLGGPIKPQAPVSELGFYSAAEQAALALPRKSGTGDSFLNDLMKGQDVKRDELSWLGLDDYLKGKPNVTRQEVQDFIANNRVDVQERQLSGRGEKFEIFSEFNPDKNQFMVYGEDLSHTHAFNTAEEADAFVKQFNSQIPYGPSKYDKYQLPGGENYREILLTLPRAKSEVFTEIQQKIKRLEAMKEIQAEFAAVGNIEKANLFATKANALEESIKKLKRTPIPKPRENYTSSHFNEPNILAHMRVNDRVDADGKKMLLIEEIQSDWHQAGREKGYNTSQAKAEIQTKIENLDTERKNLQTEQAKLEEMAKPFTSQGQDAPRDILDRWNSVSNRLNNLQREYAPLANQLSTGLAGVPDAPFKDTWHQLALKRALKYAADNGYDRVGLTTGRQQAERYQLSKQISEVHYSGTNFKAYDLDGNEVISRTGVKPEDLAGLIGKEPAKKLLEQPKQGTLQSLTGQNLDVGGEGMKKYYDEIYPAFLAKQGKKYNAKTGETRIKTGQGIPGGAPVRYIDISPEMRGGVKKGQPLFTAAPIGGIGLGAGTQDNEMPDAVRQYMADPRYSDPFADTTR